MTYACFHRPLLASLLASRLKAGGKLHIATDVDTYAQHVAAVMESDARYVTVRVLTIRSSC